MARFSSARMSAPMSIDRYARLEVERRWLLAGSPPGLADPIVISDSYLVGTRLRLRMMQLPDGRIIRKLGHKVREDPGDWGRIWCTSLYLEEAEWATLVDLPGHSLEKHRSVMGDVAVDVFQGRHEGLVLAEVDTEHTDAVPPWPAIEVTQDPRFTGGALAAMPPSELKELLVAPRTA